MYKFISRDFFSCYGIEKSSKRKFLEMEDSFSRANGGDDDEAFRKKIRDVVASNVKDCRINYLSVHDAY